MKLCLNATIGGYGNIHEFVARAKRHGYQAVEFSVEEIAGIIQQQGVNAARAIFEESGVEPVCFGLPVEWRKDHETLKEGLRELPRLARAAQAIGCTRTATWLPPSIDEFPAAYSVRMAERFREIARVLADFDVRLGLEWVGPATARTRQYDWIHTMHQLLDFEAEIGAPNLGLLVDSFHWFCMEGTVEHLEQLTNQQIVHVHINDAPNKPPKEQIDFQRLLPGEGVIDLVGFLRALKRVGYDGGIAIEVFNEDLKAMAPDEAVAKAKQAYDAVWRKAFG
ncbi:MAG: sugar phosphate isomerase/epimerase family protein [Armatimonadota bacterium]